LFSDGSFYSYAPFNKSRILNDLKNNNWL